MAKFPFQQSIYQQTQKAGQEMCLYPFAAPDIYRTRWKFSFHNPKTGFYLPSSFADCQNIRHVVIKKVSAYGIQAVVSAFFLYFFSIKFIMDIRTFPVICDSKFIDKTCRVIWIISLFFIRSISNHFFCTFNLLAADLLLVCRLLGRICDDKKLVHIPRLVGDFFIKKRILIRFGQLRDIYGFAICYPFEAGQVAAEPSPASLQKTNFSQPKSFTTLISSGFNDVCSFASQVLLENFLRILQS